VRDRLVSAFDRDPLAFPPLTGLRVLDAGCGGGILSEPLARLGASVTGIDESADLIAVARAHADGQQLPIRYQHTSAEALAARGERFDAVVSLEVIEHVADQTAFVGACAGLLAPGGILIMATLNRTLKSYALAIVGAEYLLRWLPRGTHQWQRFVKPSELARAFRSAGVVLDDVSGVVLDPLTGGWRLSRDTGVNYMAAARKPKAL
jgi:2-polyprenyl-6-hydroxyphenyl methylase/3-demethylubiquinone-9 3-methyltransferase